MFCHTSWLFSFSGLCRQEKHNQESQKEEILQSTETVLISRKYCLKIYSSKHITINPVQNRKVETGIQNVMSDTPVGIPMPLPDIETFKLKCQRTVTGSPKLCFTFINTSFDKTFILKKNVLLGILMLTNTKEKKILKFAQSVS